MARFNSEPVLRTIQAIFALGLVTVGMARKSRNVDVFELTARLHSNPRHLKVARETCWIYNFTE